MRHYLIILDGTILDVIEAGSSAKATETLGTRYAFPEAFLVIEPRLYRSSVHNAESQRLMEKCATTHGFWQDEQR